MNLQMMTAICCPIRCPVSSPIRLEMAGNHFLPTMMVSASPVAQELDVVSWEELAALA